GTPAQAPPAGKGGLDKQIEALREALRILEAQNAAQQQKERGSRRSGGRKAKPEDAKLAPARGKGEGRQAGRAAKAGEVAHGREKVKALQAERDRKAAELAQAKEQFRRAVRELDQLEGKGGARRAPGAKPVPPKPPKVGSVPPLPGLEALPRLQK